MGGKPPPNPTPGGNIVISPQYSMKTNLYKLLNKTIKEIGLLSDLTFEVSECNFVSRDGIEMQDENTKQSFENFESLQIEYKTIFFCFHVC